MVSVACRRALLSLMEDEHIARAMRAAPTPTLRRYRDRFSPTDFRALIALGRDALAVLEEGQQEKPTTLPGGAKDVSETAAYAIRGRVEVVGATTQSVANLAVELWEKNAAWSVARASVVTDDIGKFEAVVHTRDLATARREIYFRLLSDGTYIVPDPTRTWSPVEGTRVVVLAVSGTHVEGYVRNPDGTPASGYTVKALDSQMRTENLLGQTTTDANGFYSIDFAYSASKLDLMVRAYVPPAMGGGEAAHASLTTNVGQSVEVDLVIGNTALAGTAEYGAVSAAIEASRGTVAAKDLTSSDVTTIANKYGLTPRVT